MNSKKGAKQRSSRLSFRNAYVCVCTLVVISVLYSLVQFSIKVTGIPEDDLIKGRSSVRLPLDDMHKVRHDRLQITTSASSTQALGTRTVTEHPCTLADVKKHPGKVILTTTNAAFVDIADNWLESIRRTRVCPNITIVAEDKKTTDYYSSKAEVYPGLQVILTKTGTVSPDALKFNTRPFKQFVNKRQRYILDLVLEGYEVLFTDVDTFWLRDPFPYFTDDFDLAVERDLPNFYCAGFVYFKPSNKTIAFLREWIDFMSKDKTIKPDQKVMNDLIKKRRIPGLNVKTLKSTSFPNGKLFFNKKWRSDRQEIVVVHNNWIVGHDAKVARFKNCGMWLV